MSFTLHNIVFPASRTNGNPKVVGRKKRPGDNDTITSLQHPASSCVIRKKSQELHEAHHRHQKTGRVLNTEVEENFNESEISMNQLRNPERRCYVNRKKISKLQLPAANGETR